MPNVHQLVLNPYVDSDMVAGDGSIANPARIRAQQVVATQGVGIWARPETPHPLDDEFNSRTLNPAWAFTSGAVDATPIDPYANFVAGPSRVSVSQRREGWLQMQPVADGSALTITKLITSLPLNYAVWARAGYNHRLTAAANNDFSAGLTLGMEPWDNNNRINVFLNESDVGVIQCEFSTIIGGVGTTVATTANIPPNEHTPFEGVLVQRFGATNTYHAWVITNNGSCVHMGSAVFAPAVSRAGLLSGNSSGAAPGNSIISFDFIRFVEGSTFLP